MVQVHVVDFIIGGCIKLKMERQQPFSRGCIALMGLLSVDQQLMFPSFYTYCKYKNITNLVKCMYVDLNLE